MNIGQKITNKWEWDSKGVLNIMNKKGWNWQKGFEAQQVINIYIQSSQKLLLASRNDKLFWLLFQICCFKGGERGRVSQTGN